MGMAVYETGDGYHTGAVKDGFGLLLGSGLFNGDDFAVFDADVGTEQHIHFGVHGHNSDVGNQSIQI